MGATEEQLALLAAAHVTHVSYILILYSISFLLFLFTNILLHLYAVNAWPAEQDPQRNAPRGYPRAVVVNGEAERGGAGGNLRPGILKRHSTGGSVSFVGREGLPFKLVEEDEEEDGGSAIPYKSNGGVYLQQGNGKARAPRMPLPRHRQTDSQQIRDAETFELEGLIGKDGGGDGDGQRDGGSVTEEEAEEGHGLLGGGNGKVRR